MGLKGLVKEKDLYQFIKKNSEHIFLEKCLELDLKNKFIQQLLNNEELRNLSSDEKIKKYRENGYKIGKNVKISKGAILIGNKIEIGDDVYIGKYTTIESPHILIGSKTNIEENCEIVGSSIKIGEYRIECNKSNRFYSGNSIRWKNWKIKNERRNYTGRWSRRRRQW